MMAVGGAWPVTPLLAAAESQFAPDAIDSLAAVAVSPLAKLGMQPGSAVSATTLLVNFTDLFGKLSILAGAYTRVRGPPPPLIKTAAADAKSQSRAPRSGSPASFLRSVRSARGPLADNTQRFF